MPYIKANERDWFDDAIDEIVTKLIEDDQRVSRTGLLNYIFTSILVKYMDGCGGITYDRLNSLMGVLECVKQELYRRQAAPYEDEKILDNGDVDRKFVRFRRED
jgi:hypothetical protein